MLRSLALLAALFATTLSACTTHTTPYGSCSPGCMPGYSCVDGVCRLGCNPACGNGQACVSTDAGAVCVGVDAGATNDASDADAFDATIPDTNEDVAPLDAADATANDGDDAPGDANDDVPDATPDAGPPCGHEGEMCCGNFCSPGLACDGSSMCVAITRAPNECSRPTDCTGGQACGGPTTCTDHGCFVCETPPGTVAFGESCATSADCTTGVCRGQRCTIACDLGGTGAADCAAMASNYICTQILYRTGTAPMTTIVALGTCRQSCARLADCTHAGETCIPQLNFATDTMDFICGVSSGTVPVGGACASGGECQSLLCVPGVGDGGTGACTAPCIADTDCPPLAPHCAPISWTRPDGTGQSGLACLP